MQFRRISFHNSRGERLDARLDLPDPEPPAAYAVFAHCFTCTKDYNVVYHISKVLAESGIAVLRFDFTGLGESEGDFARTTFSSNVDDLKAAADFLEKNHGAPKLLIGHSLGGAAALLAAARISAVTAIATIAAPAQTSTMLRLFEGVRDQILREGEAEIKVAGRPFRIGKSFLEDLERNELPQAVRSLGKALMVFHSPEDRVVPFRNAEEIFAAAAQPKSFVSVPGADHLLSNRRDGTYVGGILAAWASRYVK